MNDLLKKIALGQIRSAVIAIGAPIAAQGYMSQDGVTAIAGAVVTIAGFVWSGVDKYLADKKAKSQAAAAQPPAPASGS